MAQALSKTSELNRPVDGADTDVWGPLCIGIFDAWDRHFGGRENIDMTSADVTLSTSQAQNGQIITFGTPVADRNLIFPSRNRSYFVRNGTGRTLACHVTGFATNADKLFIPNGTSLLVTINTSGQTRAGSAPIHSTGGHPNSVTHPLALTGGSATYNGPGIWFEDVLVGLARRAAGVMGIGLKDGGDTLRFNSANTGAAPMIGFGASDFSAYDSGFYELSRSIAWSRSSAFQGSLGQGIQIGTPTGGEKGIGTLNAQGIIHRNGTAIPFQRTFSQLSLSVASAAAGFYPHGLTVVPSLLVGHLRCTVVNNGYSVGMVTAAAQDELTLAADSTNIYYRIRTGGLQLPGLSTGVVFTLNSSQWVLDYRAYA